MHQWEDYNNWSA